MFLFSSVNFFSKLLISFCNTIRVPNCLDHVSSDLGPNSLERLSQDDKKSR